MHFLLGMLVLSGRVLDDVVELHDFDLLFLDDLLGLLMLLDFLVKFDLDHVSFLDRDAVIKVFSSQCRVLGLDLFLELGDLVLCDLELTVEFSHIVLGLQQVLGVEVLLRSDCLVQVLLLFKLGFEFDVFFLEF